MRGNSIGLDIGFSKIKAVSLSRQNNSYALNGFSIIPSPVNGIFSDDVSGEKEMAKAIKKAVGNLKVSSKDVNVAIPDSRVYIKIIEMPVLSDKELSLAIYWEAERHIPVALSTITLVWNVLKRPKDVSGDEKMQVLMVGAPTKIIDKYRRVLKMANLNLDAIETEILAIIRALVTPNFPPSLILNIGAINTSLAIIRNGVLALTYSMPVGGDAVSRSIEQDFGLTMVQSEEYKKTYGFLKEGVAGEKIGKSAEPILNSILVEVRKVLAFYAQKYKDESSLAQILLSGGTAHLPGINKFFVENLGIETLVVNPWKIFGNKPLPTELSNSSSDFTVALGLAMRNL